MTRPKNTPMQEQAKVIVKNNLERLMTAKRMSQIELAEKAGIPKTTINGYVKGTSLPTPGNTEKLALIFKVSKDEIDPRFNSEAFEAYNMEEAKKKLGESEFEFFEQLIEKALSLNEHERESFLENIRFAVEYFDKRGNGK